MLPSTPILPITNREVSQGNGEHTGHRSPLPGLRSLGGEAEYERHHGSRQFEQVL